MSAPNTRNVPLPDRQKPGQQEPCWRVSDSSGTVGAHDGIRTHDPNLTKIVRYPCATWAFLALPGESHYRMTLYALCAPLDGWAVEDSNLRRRKPTDLQSVPFGHFGNCPGIGTSYPMVSLLEVGADGRARTDNLLFTKQLLCH